MLVEADEVSVGVSRLPENKLIIVKFNKMFQVHVKMSKSITCKYVGPTVYYTNLFEQLFRMGCVLLNYDIFYFQYVRALLIVFR